MSRSGLVRLLVLDSICDDYENVDQVILRDVSTQAAKLGLTIERSEIVDALAGLIEDGLAKAYILSPTRPSVTELPGMPRLDAVEEDFKTYFYITEKGMDLQLSDDKGWPFDDQGQPLRDWRLDSPQS